MRKRNEYQFLKAKLNKYEKRLLLNICIHYFDSDVISNMDRMRISGT